MQRNLPAEVKCKQCGKVFNVAKWRALKAKYCSPECHQKGVRTSQNINNIRRCVTCGKEYFPSNWTQKHCSRKCFASHNQKVKEIACRCCGKVFRQARASQKYCSRECISIREKVKHKTVKFNKNYSDRLWAEAVKIAAGQKCEYCGISKSLNSHHIFSRTNLATRWDMDNGICLCVSHHVFGIFSAHKSPIEFIEWLRTVRGEEWYERLRSKAKSVAKGREEITYQLQEYVNSHRVNLTKQESGVLKNV